MHISEAIVTSGMGESFGNMKACEISRKLANEYEKVAKSLGIEFMDAAKITEPSEIDGLHLSEEGHKALGEAFAKVCLNLCGD